jgi:glycosyltransferase involved in cell wall biosynthesis
VKNFPKIFIVIPLFNEEKHVVDVLKDVSKSKLPVIVVDDGSTDRSGEKIIDCRLKNIELLRHKINLGKGAAMKTGADYAFEKGADAIIFMDSDGQHQAEDLPKFIDALNSNKFDVVFGTRNYNYGVPLVRFLGNKFASVIMTTFFKVYISDVLCGFKGMTKEAYEKIRWESSGYGVEMEIVARLAKNKLRFDEVPVKTIYHDKVKGVTMLDAFGILAEVVKWKFTI